MLMDDPHLYLNPAKYFQTAPCVWMRTCWCSWFLTLDHSRGGCPSVWSKSRLGSYLEFILRCSAVTRGSTPGLLKFTWDQEHQKNEVPQTSIQVIFTVLSSVQGFMGSHNRAAESTRSHVYISFSSFGDLRIWSLCQDRKLSFDMTSIWIHVDLLWVNFHLWSALNLHSYK